MFIKTDGEKILAMAMIKSALPKDYDPEKHAIEMLKWDGEKVIWKSKTELAVVNAEREHAEKAAAFKAKTGLIPEAFGVFVALKKIIDGDSVTTDDKQKVAAFIDKHLTEYEGVK